MNTTNTEKYSASFNAGVRVAHRVHSIFSVTKAAGRGAKDAVSGFLSGFNIALRNPAPKELSE